MPPIGNIASMSADGCSALHFNVPHRLLRTPLMRSWKVLIGTLMLFLMLWTGGLAHAAEQVDCIPATAESAGHYEGDRDQRPSDREQGVAHHHTGCSGHQLAAPLEQPVVIPSHSASTVPLARSHAYLHGHDPDGQLRPPIA